MHDSKASIRIPKLGCNSLRITAYSDTALASNVDLSSQLGRIILLTEDNDNSIPIPYKSCTSLERVARSILSAEVIAFPDLFDDALAIRKQLEFALRQPMPVHILTDSKSLLGIIRKGIRMSEKRIMLDVCGSTSLRRTRNKQYLSRQNLS